MDVRLQTVAECFERLAKLGYQWPKGSVPEVLTAAYVAALSDLAVDEITHAFDRFVAGDVYGRWPTPGALRHALDDPDALYDRIVATGLDHLPARQRRAGEIAWSYARTQVVDALTMAGVKRRTFATHYRAVQRVTHEVRTGLLPPEALPLTQRELHTARRVERWIQSQRWIQSREGTEADVLTLAARASDVLQVDPLVRPKVAAVIAEALVEGDLAAEDDEEDLKLALQGKVRGRLDG